MEFNVKCYGKKYIVEQDSDLSGKRNRTGGLLLRKLEVLNKQQIVYTMEQKSWIKKILINCLYLFFRPQMFPSYLIYKNGVTVGKSVYKLFKGASEQLYIEDLKYELKLYGNNYMSVFENDVQVALVRKAEITYFNQDEYSVQCDKKFCQNKELLLLLVMCLDIAFWSKRIGWSVLRWEKTIGRVSHSECIEWKPKNP